MRAVVHDRYGPPDVLRLEDVARPVPKGDEVLVRIHATTVNRTDPGFRSAEFFVARFFTGLLRPRRKILGSEFAGEVEALGAAVTEFAVWTLDARRRARPQKPRGDTVSRPRESVSRRAVDAQWTWKPRQLATGPRGRG